MADGDYICVYRQFFEEFAKSSEIEDSRPMRLNVCDLMLDELIGEIMQSCVNILTERQCPNSLVVPLTRIVAEELLSEAKKQPDEANNFLKLYKKTQEKISEVCLRYSDNEKLSSLPAPVPETPFSSHSTKHTRRRMEDRHICLPRFNTLHGIKGNSEAEYYGIFDGHAGATAASFAVSHLHQFLAESQFYPDEPVPAFLEAYEKTDIRFNSKKEECGTTSLAILHQPEEKRLTVSWVGDSQALLVTKDSYVMLVNPHKPERQDERKRIENLGGFLLKMQNTFRVNGELAISRAIGDKKLKPFVCAEPEIRVFKLTGAEHFVVMGSDGLWDVVEPIEVIETVYFELKNSGGRVESVAKRLVDLAKENNSADNITVIVFFLANPQDINSCAVDVTGHRPKLPNQHGLIMEANYQSNNSALNGIYETSNGMHHNSLGYEDRMRNDLDEDLGPETNVDVLDDVLVSPGKANNNNNNPFAAVNDYWQQKNQFSADAVGKLIMYSGSLEDSREVDVEDRNEYQDGGFADSVVKMSVDGEPDVVRMSENVYENDFTNLKFASNNLIEKSEEGDEGIYDVNAKYKSGENDSTESPVGDYESHPWKEETQSNKYSLDDENLFQETIIERNHSNALKIKSNGEENNDCVSEIVRTEMMDKANTDLTSFEACKSESYKAEPEQVGNEIPEIKKLDDLEDYDYDGGRRSGESSPDVQFGKNCPESPETVGHSEDSHEVGACDAIESIEKMEANTTEREIKSAEEEEEEALPETEPETDFFAGEKSPNAGSDPNLCERLSPVTFNNVEEAKNEEIFAPDTQEMETDALQRDTTMAALDVPAANSPELGSATDAFEAENEVLSSFPTEEPEVLAKSEIDTTPDLLVPMTPAPDGEIKDEIVGESGGEVEDSEDDEWNYIKVGPGIGVPLEDQQKPDSESIEEPAQEGKAVAMNSPLNPDAAEFIPVSPLAARKEGFNDVGTPVKNVPADLASADIVASSPNWTTMGNISIPEESAFLDEIKSRPSNVVDEHRFSQKSDFDPFKVEEEEPAKEKRIDETANEFGDFEMPPKQLQEEPKTALYEPHGIELAKDMTGSFIDPDTMTEEKDDLPQMENSYVTEVQEPIFEKKVMHLSNEIPQSQEPSPLLEETKSTPEPFEAAIEKVAAPASLTPATPKSTTVEASSSPDSEPSTLPIGSVEASPLLELNVEDSKESVTVPLVETPPSMNVLTSPNVESSKPLEQPAVEEIEEKSVAQTVGAAASAVAAVGAVAGAAASVKKDEKKSTLKSTAGKTTKPAATKPAASDAKTLGAARKPPAKTTLAAKTASSPVSGSNLTNSTASKMAKNESTKTTSKSPISVASSVTKVSASRPRPATVNATATKTTTNKTGVSTTLKSTTATTKPSTRTTTSTTASAPKPKSRITSAPADKKPTMNGEIKTSAAPKKPIGTTTVSATRVSLASRPLTAPAKTSTVSKTTMTTTRTTTAKPRTSITNSTTTTTTTTTTTVTTAGRISSVTKRTTIGSEKQAKEMANRLTSKTTTTSATPKTSGTTLTKAKKTTTTTTTTRTGSTPSKTKPTSKTEIKADMIVDKTVDFIQSESEKHLMENTKDINLINSIASE